MLKCPNCSFQNSRDATFCVNCGQSLARSNPAAGHISEAERRYVTILFADISGFTALTESRDPELVREIINTCFDLLVPIVEAHNGVVDQFVGDAIVALFGAPIAHEDDPAQACRAGLDMLGTIELVNAKYNLSLGLHIGINSGMVIAGGVGSRGRQQYSVLGDAVNLASRLQDAAERGEIFVGDETHNLTHEQFEYVSRGVESFKGKSEPQPVWQLIGVRDRAPGHRRIFTNTPLLGRARELALLQRVTRDLVSEAGGLRVVSILGDAGLGKSRLILEWHDVARQASEGTVPQFLVAACAPDSSMRAYAMLTELVRVLGSPQVKDTNGSASLRALLGMGTDTETVAPLDGTALQARYTAGLRDLLVRRAAQAPLILVCEDLHWADAPSTEVLKRALAQLAEANLVIGFTSRVEPETAGWQLIQATEELPGTAAVRLNLTPLTEPDANALLASLLPGSLPQEIRQLVMTQSEGNPLFVEELARMFLDRGDLKRENEQWVLARTRVPLNVPNTLQGVLLARVDQLPPDARRVLQIASVLGREFSLQALKAMMARLDRDPEPPRT